MSPTTIREILALDKLTFILLISDKNPNVGLSYDLFDLTVEKIIISFSRP